MGGKDLPSRGLFIVGFQAFTILKHTKTSDRLTIGFQAFYTELN